MTREETRELLRPVLSFFYLQRCGCELTAGRAGAFAHPACHTAPAVVYGTGETRDVAGGWHDAGDYGRYAVPGAKAAFDLMLAALAAPALFDGDEALDEARCELEWLLKMQREDGAVYHKVTCAAFCGFIPPHEEREQLILAPVSTTATGDFAGAMALASVAYRQADEAFAARCQAAARRAHAFLTASPPLPFHNPPGISTGEYDDACDADERLLAAAALLAATGEDAFAAQTRALLKRQPPLGLGWADVGSYALLLLAGAHSRAPEPLRGAAQARLLERAAMHWKNAARDPLGLSLCGEFPWGSNMYLLNHAAELCAAWCLCGQARFLDAAKRHLAYVLGDNPLRRCFITGRAPNPPMHPHHRPSAARGQPMPGMLVGGPDAGLHDPCARALLAGRPPAQRYVDDVDSYSTNEVAVYWNSALVLLLALLDGGGIR